MSTVVVGEVSSLEGMVRAIEPTTQSVRILEEGDAVFQNELLITSSPANLMLTLNNGEILTLGRNSELFLDGDVFSEVISNNEAVADVATLQQFVLEGNFDALEEPAAGVEGSPGSAVEAAVEIERTAAEGEVTAGFTTFGGASTEFIIPIEDEVVIETGTTTFESSFILDPGAGNEELQANPDVNTIVEDSSSVNGNVILGTGGSLAGSDQLSMDDSYVVSVNGLPVGDPASNAVSIPGLYGSLEISADGTYTYYLDNGNSTVQGLDDSETISDVFVYTLRDGDNDTSSTTLTITINGETDAPPTVVVEDVDGALTAADNSVVEGSSAIVTGTFTVTAEAGIASVTVNGVSIINASSSTPVLIAGSQGVLTITGYNPTTGIVSYEFKEDGIANDHSAGDDSVQDLFTITVTDVAGTPVSDDLNIQILDTAPVAESDANSITEDAINPSVGGNVITGTNGQGVNPASVDTLAADPTSVSEVDGVPVVSGTPTEVTGLYGTLTFNADGSYTYELDNSNPDVQVLTSADSISESFNYVLSDNDGDSSSAALTITINGSDDGLPVVIDCDESVVEGLGNTVTGVFGVQAQAGVDSITVGGVNIMNATVSSPVVIQGSEGDLTITGYNPQTGEVSYSYTIDTDTSDHSAGDNSVQDTFEVVVTDLAGQTVVDYHDIQILDTAPTAVNDVNNITEDDFSVAGNVIGGNSGQGVDVIGTDPTVVSSVSGTPVTATPAVIVGTYGTLTLSEDGGYVYLLDNTNMTVQALSASSLPLKETFSYTLTDNDGDTSSAILEIIINGQDDAPPVIEIQDADLNVSPADNSVVEGSSDTVTGVINVSADVGVVSIEIQGVEVSGATPTTPIIIPGAQGTLTIIGYNPVSGDVTYEYTEDGLANTHSATDDNVVDNFFVEVTDASGESTTDSLDIQILDTAPVAQADNNNITEDDNIVAGNVIVNTNNDATQSDILGADATVVTSIDGVSVSSGTATVSGAYGTLTINADGSYSYELNNNHSDVQGLNDGELLEDTFEYVITDADGDSSTTTLTITINGVTDGAPIITVTDNDAAAGDHSVEEGSTTP
ncbi:MAG: retention module-containing protein, partial [Thiomicrorhabdus sp.]|nr:retention module-containing protein [Thiomicrorhabdus sp.]